ncbi:MAG: N-acyl homoserine lactonase family protein [Acidobacteria bacterium]|nr:N-acyl homoserine lactonase family protein [Acidobacteriota bacterium]
MTLVKGARVLRALVAVGVLGALAGAPSASGEVEPQPAASQESGSVRLYVLDCGYIFMVDEILEILSLAPDEVPSRDMAVPCYLVEHPRGTLVWDTGLPFAPEAENTLESQLAEIGYAFGDITYVAMSHMHGDHAGNANAFKDSIWLAREAEREYAFSGETGGVGWGTPEIYSELENSETIVIEGDDDHDVFGDGRVVIVSTPGHTPGHQVLFVDLAETGPIVLSGDLYHTAPSYELRRVPTFNFDEAQTRASFEKLDAFMEETGAELWIEHDHAHHESLRKAPEYYP